MCKFKTTRLIPLATYKEATNYTQQQIAGLAGLHQNAVSQMLRDPKRRVYVIDGDDDQIQMLEISGVKGRSCPLPRDRQLTILL